MWRSMSASRKIPRGIRYLLIIPAILGKVLAPSVVLWMPASMWPMKALIAIAFIVAAILIFAVVVSIYRRARSAKEIDVEECAFLVGLVISLFVGLWFCSHMLPEMDSQSGPRE